MHFEILVEDQSGCICLEHLLPKILGTRNEVHSWRLHAYKGIGAIPKDFKGKTDVRSRILLDRLPAILKAYGKTAGIDAVVVVLDSDRRNCADFVRELKELAFDAAPRLTVLFRLAVEEMEAWYLGDREALLQAYPKAKTSVLQKYVQDSVCGTWELLADAIYPGGSAGMKKSWTLSGQLKCEWANSIGALLDPKRNTSPSFRKFRDGTRKVAAD